MANEMDLSRKSGRPVKLHMHQRAITIRPINDELMPGVNYCHSDKL